MRIAFVHRGLESYVQKDLDILRSAHEVRPVCFAGRQNLAVDLLPNLRQLWKEVLWCDVTFSWFGKLHAFFAVLFSRALGRKSVVVAGGDDVERGVIGGKPYGMTATIPGRWLAYYVFQQADLVLPVSQFNFQQTISNARAIPQRTRMIYHGFDSNTVRPAASIRKESCVLTVGQVNQENYYRKGHKLFAETAHLLPDVPFYLAGAQANGALSLLKPLEAPNLVYTGKLSTDGLYSLMSRCAVYVQASEWESFGCSVAEAMLCECTPVVSRRTALPEVVGDCGFYTESLEPQALAAKIREALEAGPEMGKRARQRIVECFPIERRRRLLLEAVASVNGAGDRQ